MKGVVIGLGNDIMRDDAAGLKLARSLSQHPALPPGVQVIETGEMGLSLLDVLDGKDWAIFVDSVKTGENPVGHIHRFEGKDVVEFRSRNPHNMGIGEVFYIGHKLGLNLPNRIVILAMEVKDNHSFGYDMTQEANAGFTRFLTAVFEEVKRCTSMA